MAGPEIQLRPAQADDALCLSVLAMQVFLDTDATEGIRPSLACEVLSSDTAATFSAAIEHSAVRLWVAERQGHLVGFAQLTLGESHALAPAGKQAELLRLYVQEPFTGQHIGSRLLVVAETLAAQGGASVLWLTPWVHNHRALGFYRQRGCQDFGLTPFVFEGECHDNRLVAKWLAPAGAAVAQPDAPQA